MRQIILDTETTGLEPPHHRIIEVGAVEITGRKMSATLHHYLNPERDIDAGAEAVHGLSRDFLADKPKFRDVAADIIAFISGAELIIHNAPFDVGFLDAELARMGKSSIKEICTITDTLRMARALHPGKRNSLDALCERYEIDNTGRTLHGALLDAQLLGEVFLAMTRGQDSLDIGLSGGDPARNAARYRRPTVLRVVRATAAERAAHELQILGIQKASKGNAFWVVPQSGASS